MDELNSGMKDLSALKIDRSRRPGPPGRWKRWLHLLWFLVPVIIYFGYQLTLKRVAPALQVKTDVASFVSGTEASGNRTRSRV